MSIESSSGASEFEREYAELKAALRQALTDRGLSLTDLKGASRDDSFFRSLLESADAILKPKGIYTDSLIMTEAVVELEEEADGGDNEGGAGVREPRRPHPDSDPYGLLAQARETPEMVAYGDGEGTRFEMESPADQERRAVRDREGPFA